MLSTSNDTVKCPSATVLSILLDARKQIGDLFGQWDEIDELAKDPALGPAAWTFRHLDKAIEKLGGPTIERTYAIMDDVLGGIPGDIENEPAAAQVILEHCARLAAASW